MRKLLITLLILLSSATAFAISQGFFEQWQRQNAFSRIEKVMADKEWVQAEKLLVDYLRAEMDMNKSWQAWVLLIEASQKAQLHGGIVLSYLDDMLKDYSKDADKKKYILLQIARTKESLGSEEEAIEALIQYANLPNLLPEEAFAASEKLIHWHFKQGNFSAAEDVLYNCLSLTLPDKDTAFCMYSLAEIYAGKGSYETANELLQQLQSLDVDAYQLSQINFLHGDILEQQRKYTQALTHFELALPMYGNRAVVEQRIADLKKHNKKK